MDIASVKNWYLECFNTLYIKEWDPYPSRGIKIGHGFENLNQILPWVLCLYIFFIVWVHLCPYDFKPYAEEVIDILSLVMISVKLISDRWISVW